MPPTTRRNTARVSARPSKAPDIASPYGRTKPLRNPHSPPPPQLPPLKLARPELFLILRLASDPERIPEQPEASEDALRAFITQLRSASQWPYDEKETGQMLVEFAGQATLLEHLANLRAFFAKATNLEAILGVLEKWDVPPCGQKKKMDYDWEDLAFVTKNVPARYQSCFFGVLHHGYVAAPPLASAAQDAIDELLEGAS